MKELIVTFLFALICIPTFAQRIIILTPDVADIISELGAANEVIAIHEYNTNPVYKNKPTIGFYRSFSAEPIVSQKPDLVIGSWMAKPDSIYAKLKQSGIQAENINPSETLADYQNSIIRIGKLIHKEQQASILSKKFAKNIKSLTQTKKRYILSYDGRYVSGRNTVGDTLIKLSGGINAAANIEGLKPLSREGWLAAKPDIIILAKHNESLIGGIDKFRQRPEIAISQAAQNNKIQFLNADDFMRYGLYTPNLIKYLHDLGL